MSEILNDNDYVLLLPSVMVNMNPVAMDGSELRPWLFETYTICNDKDAYDVLNDKVKFSYTFTQSPLRDETLHLTESTFRQRKAWFRESIVY